MYNTQHWPLVWVWTDLDQSRLDFAKTMGASAVIKVSSKDPKVTASQVEEVLEGLADITIECSGAPPSIRTAIYVSVVTSLSSMEMLHPSLVDWLILFSALLSWMLSVSAVNCVVDCWSLLYNTILCLSSRLTALTWDSTWTLTQTTWPLSHMWSFCMLIHLGNLRFKVSPEGLL